ncbi:MAG: hypothetical protein H6R09_260 [Proteobacteria bacterium]|jgi:hypothetical protein|nr:hypothetical protein [Pseudomonadota bacterium]
MLTLNVPRTEDAVPQHEVETRPKATTAWLARLPFASPVDTARQLMMALYALNRRPLGVAERHTLLALYRPVVMQVAASLEEQLAEAGVPPLVQQRQAGVLLRELLTEYSIGYKHLLLTLANRRFGRTPPRLVAEVTARLLAAQRDIQVACYLTYSPPPAGLWLEMHQLFQLVLSSGTADKAVGDALPPSQVYRQALLLALADPPHLSRAELAHTRLYLDKFAALAGLRPATASPPPSAFAVPTDSDRGPGPLPASLKPGSLWLDAEPLCRHLHEVVVRLRTGDSPRLIGLPQGMGSELSYSLGKHLLKLWRSGAQRAFKRYPATDNSVQVVAGVSAIHRLLDTVPQSAEGDSDADDSLPIHDVGPLFAAPAPVSASCWTIDNDSAAGLALSGAPDTSLNLKIGDALALRAHDADAWSLGVIRWIRMRDARQVELGVERLSPQMQPVWVRPLRGHRKASPEPALFVPGLPALNRPDRLLLPRHLYQTGMDAEVWQPPQQYTLTFGRRHEHTPSFDLVDFTLFSDFRP